jgi:selenoprotein W-related protein
MVKLPAVTITYCSQCNWLLRAAWIAQELLSSFSTDLASVTLVPGTGGIYEIKVDDELIWERKRDGGFLKRRR